MVCVRIALQGWIRLAAILILFSGMPKCAFLLWKSSIKGFQNIAFLKATFAKGQLWLFGLQYEALPVAHQKKYRDVFRSGYFFRPKGASPKHNPAVCNLQSSASIHRFDPNSLLYILKVCSLLSDHCPYAMMSIIPSIL